MILSLLSTDLILLILEVTDPESLLQFCRVSHCPHMSHACSYIISLQASPCIYYLVMDTKSLRYQVELASAGMKDGPPSQHPPPSRLEQLLSFKKTWPSLSGSYKDSVKIRSPTIMGVSGGFFYHASDNSDNNGFQWTLELYELRSFRTGRSDSPLRYLKYNISLDIKKLTIDPLRNLLVLVELDQPTAYVSFHIFRCAFITYTSAYHVALIPFALVSTTAIYRLVLFTRTHSRIILLCTPTGGRNFSPNVK